MKKSDIIQIKRLEPGKVYYMKLNLEYESGIDQWQMEIDELLNSLDKENRPKIILTSKEVDLVEAKK